MAGAHKLDDPRPKTYTVPRMFRGQRAAFVVCRGRLTRGATG